MPKLKSFTSMSQQDMVKLEQFVSIPLNGLLYDWFSQDEDIAPTLDKIITDKTSVIEQTFEVCLFLQAKYTQSLSDFYQRHKHSMVYSLLNIASNLSTASDVKRFTQFFNWIQNQNIYISPTDKQGIQDRLVHSDGYQDFLYETLYRPSASSLYGSQLCLRDLPKISGAALYTSITVFNEDLKVRIKKITTFSAITFLNQESLGSKVVPFLNPTSPTSRLFDWSSSFFEPSALKIIPQSSFKPKNQLASNQPTIKYKNLQVSSSKSDIKKHFKVWSIDEKQPITTVLVCQYKSGKTCMSIRFNTAASQLKFNTAFAVENLEKPLQSNIVIEQIKTEETLAKIARLFPTSSELIKQVRHSLEEACVLNDTTTYRF